MLNIKGHQQHKMTDADIPDFNLGIKSHLLIYEGDQDDFSSSGDEIIQNIMETSEVSINENKDEESRFKSTTAEERDLLLTEAEAKNTKRSTKAHVKIFRGKKITKSKYFFSNTVLIKPLITE